MAIARHSTASDLLMLTKPRLSSLVICTTAGGLWLAPGGLGPVRTLLTLLSVSLVVGAANALNCWYERDSDKHMTRTANRPLPSGRMEPNVALWFGIGLAALSLPILALASNLLTGVLAAIAFFSYVLVYTPLKRRTPAAMLVGAVPGALPPLMGWTAVTGRIDAPGMVLFSILFLWQIPHFIAISIFRREEYARAGLKVLAAERGEPVARAYVVAYLIPLVAISVLPFTLGVAGWVYLVAALGLGFWFLGVGMYGFVKQLGAPWAKNLFLTSLVYLTGLFMVLMLDARLA